MSANDKSIEALREHGKATQFGGNKANPHHSMITGGVRPWGIRNAVRHLMKMGTLSKDAKGKFTLDLPPKAGPGQILAAQAMVDALNSKSPNARLRAIQWLDEMVDGKLHQLNVNAGVADLENMSEEELDELERQLDAELAELSTADDGSADRGLDAQAPDRDENAPAEAPQNDAGKVEGSAASIGDRPL